MPVKTTGLVLAPGEYATLYKQIRSISLRSILRYIALSGLAAFYRAIGQKFPTLTRERVQFLYLHHVFEDEEESFRKILRLLSRNHIFISYSEAVDRIWTGRIDKPYISISFDDGLKSCLRAAQIMDEFGIKACFFLCVSMIGETDYSKIREFCSSRLHLPPVEFLSWDDGEALLQAGHEFGSHTMSHPDLAQLSRAQIQTEIADSYDFLAQRIGAVKHFSWPYGRFTNFTPDAARIVFETGFGSCASAERGCHVAQPEKHELKYLCIRRNNFAARWPIDHVLYFMAKNSHIASIFDNQWPQEWYEIIQGSSGARNHLS